MSFDRLAPFYRTMEFLSAGGKLHACRTAFLDEIPSPSKILLAGEGHGRGLPGFARKFPHAEITVIDSSSKMLEIARRQMPAMSGGKQVGFVHADVLTWAGPPGEYDLIVTNFFLDCFPQEQLPEVISRLARCATPGAAWLLADFQIPARGFPKWRARLILALLYAFFRVVCGLEARALVPPENDLRKAGFSLKEKRTRDWGLLKSEWWERVE